MIFLLMTAISCASPSRHLKETDSAVAGIIQSGQMKALGHTEPFTIVSAEQSLRHRLLSIQNLPYSHPGSLGFDVLEPIQHWPDISAMEGSQSHPALIPPWQQDEAMPLSLFEALQVAARNNRQYMTAKERVFQTALALDFERAEYRTTLQGLLTGEISTDGSGAETISGVENSATATLTRKLKTGAEIATQLTIDLVKLLTQDRSSSFGIFADASVSIPLLRGAGRHISAETLTQAEHDVIYAILEFERFKRIFAVDIADTYLNVLQQLDQVANSRENYLRLLASTKRARRLAEAGRLPEIQVDQVAQDELRARNSWIRATQGYGRSLDSLKISLGLPPDSNIKLDRTELERLAKEYNLKLKEIADFDMGHDVPTATDIEFLSQFKTYHGNTYNLEIGQAIALALDRRLDLRIAQKRVEDAQRKVVVAADGMRADVNLVGTASIGDGRTLSSAGLDNAELKPANGNYAALLNLDLPFNRAGERRLLRQSIIDLDQAVRNLQENEDQVKLQIRDLFRDLLEFREALTIQTQSVQVAERRVKSAELFLQAGRAQIRDLLEAQDALVSAQNSLSAAAVNYRVAELALQRDMGVFEVNEKGLWQEYSPEDGKNNEQ